MLDVGGGAEEGILRARIGERQEATKREGGVTEKMLSKSSLEDLCRYYQLPPSFLDIDEEGILDEVLRRHRKGEEVIPKLLTMMRELDAHPVGAVSASSVLEGIAKRDPGAVKPAIAGLLKLLPLEQFSLVFPALQVVAEQDLELVNDMVMPKAIGLFAGVLRKSEDKGALSENSLYECTRWLQFIAYIGAKDPQVVKVLVPTLIKLLDSEYRGKWAIAYCIGRVAEGKPEMVMSAVPGLVALLDHEEPLVRVHAAYALGQIGAEEAIGPLAKLLGDDSEGHCHWIDSEQAVSEVAKRAIALIHDKASGPSKPI